MVFQGIARYWRRLRRFSSNARFFLLSEVIVGLSFSIYGLFFNLYVVSRGYPRSFLGELQSLPHLIALFAAVPCGMLVDHIGRKRALVLSNISVSLSLLGVVFSPGANWLRLSMISLGLAHSFWLVSGSPFMMENSTDEERNTLYSAHFGLTTLVGFLGTIVGGYLPTLFGGLLDVDVESAPAYAATLSITFALSAFSLLPILLIREGSPSRDGLPRSVWPWRNLSDRGLAVRIFLPNIIISMGAAILIPYMNLFFKDTFQISDRVLGTIFAVSALVTGTVTLASPLLADRWGRIRSLVFTQLTSIPFLLVIGFVPFFPLAAFAFWARGALMNMGSPLYEAFAMEQLPARERATVSGLMGMSWNIGWTLGPYLSGFMQDNPNIGFKPIFLITCSLYLLSALLVRVFFQHRDDSQRRAALLQKMGVVDLTAARARERQAGTPAGAD